MDVRLHQSSRLRLRTRYGSEFLPCALAYLQVRFLDPCMRSTTTGLSGMSSVSGRLLFYPCRHSSLDWPGCCSPQGLIGSLWAELPPLIYRLQAFPRCLWIDFTIWLCPYYVSLCRSPQRSKGFNILRPGILFRACIIAPPGHAASPVPTCS